MISCLRPIERAKPLLGTIVAIRADGLGDDAGKAIDAAFEEIALIHRLMSFHEEESDVSRLNREAYRAAIAVHAHTSAVLREAQLVSAASNGVFDITSAPALVDSGLLPAPRRAQLPDRIASWQDIALLDGNGVQFRRPLWIDRGGIAKGYAVDVAVEILIQRGAPQICVNAGGDLRIAGPEAEPVRLRPEAIGDAVPMIEVKNAALASSSGHRDRRVYNGALHGPHIDGATRQAVPTDRFVSVAAERCLLADALTKAVLVSGAGSEGLLKTYGAAAHLYQPRDGWRHFGGC